LKLKQGIELLKNKEIEHLKSVLEHNHISFTVAKE